MGPDEVIHQSLRLKIMATLNALPRAEKIEFPRLKGLLKATDGNLGGHISPWRTPATSRSRRTSPIASRAPESR